MRKTEMRDGASFIKVRIDLENGYGALIDTAKWRALDPLLRADVARDLMMAMNALYEDAVERLREPQKRGAA